MKKLLLTLIVSIALCGSLFAQYHTESHWPDFYYPDYEDQEGIVAAIKIDGNIIDANYPSWNQLEVAAFVGNDECRANWIFLYNGYVEEYGDPFPIIDGEAIFFTEPGDELYFKMYDHVNGIEYDLCDVMYLDEPITVRTGEDHSEGWNDPENPIFLCFTSPAGIQKNITGYESNPDGNWYLISSPVGDVEPGAVTNMVDITGERTFDLFRLNAADVMWESFVQHSQDFTLEAGKGYLYASETDVTLTFPGSEYTGSGEVALDYVETGLQGINIIGNPFNYEASVNMPYYKMNDEGSGFTALIETGDPIAPMEGIIVEAEAAGQIASFTAAGGEKRAISNANILVRGENGKVLDNAIVRFDEGATLSKFQYQGFKNTCKLYIPQNGKNYAIVNALEEGEMPLNFKAETTGTYTISFKLDGVNVGYLHLLDKATGEDIDLLANGEYSFIGSPRDAESRFTIRFSETAANDCFVYQNDDQLIVRGEGTLQVFDVMGRFVGSYEVNGTERISASQFSNAVYVFRLIGNEIQTQKIVVR